MNQAWHNVAVTETNSNSHRPSQPAKARFLADLKQRLEALTYEEREGLIRAGGKVLSRTRRPGPAKSAPAKPRARAAR